MTNKSIHNHDPFDQAVRDKLYGHETTYPPSDWALMETYLNREAHVSPKGVIWLSQLRNHYGKAAVALFAVMTLSVSLWVSLHPTAISPIDTHTFADIDVNKPNNSVSTEAIEITSQQEFSITNSHSLLSSNNTQHANTSGTTSAQLTATTHQSPNHNNTKADTHIQKITNKVFNTTPAYTTAAPHTQVAPSYLAAATSPLMHQHSNSAAMLSTPETPSVPPYSPKAAIQNSPVLIPLQAVAIQEMPLPTVDSTPNSISTPDVTSTINNEVLNTPSHAHSKPKKPKKITSLPFIAMQATPEMNKAIGTPYSTFGYTTGVTVGWQINDKWSAGTGIEFSQKQIESKIELPSFNEIGSLNNINSFNSDSLTTSTPTPFPDPTADINTTISGSQSAVISSDMNLVKVPIWVRYHIGNSDKIKPYVSAAVIAYKRHAYNTSTSLQFDILELRPGISIKLNNKLRAQLEGRVSSTLRSKQLNLAFAESAKGNDKYVFSSGLSLGLSIDLK